MQHPSADSPWFTFLAPSSADFRVYAFSDTEEVHKPYEYEIELVHDSPDRGMTYAAKILAIPDTTHFVPASGHPRYRVTGAQTAIVSGPAGEEIFPDQYGRVKVQFHWDRLRAHDENTTCWIRISQGWAGSQYGTMSVGQDTRCCFCVACSCKEKA